MKYKLILTDLDDTLLHSDKTISPYTLDVLRRCQEAGALIGFSTSRGRPNIALYESQVHPDVIICNGGALTFLKNECIRSVHFTLDETRALIAKAYEVIGPCAEMTVDLETGFFWNRHVEERSTGYALGEYDDLLDFRQPAQKICVQTADRATADTIATAVHDVDYLPFSDIPWFKYSPAAATKENALSFLVEKLGISLDEVIAFGDDFNDIGMLKMAGRGVAMGNAIPEVKAAADEVIGTCNEDGVAHLLEGLLA